MSGLLAEEIIIRVCCWILFGIASPGGTIQFLGGQPDTTARLDNIHRFLAGIYFSAGLIAFYNGY